MAERAREPVSVGRDVVHFIENGIVIWAAAEMADWEVRAFCKIPIFYENQKFYLSERASGKPPHPFKYYLKRWPAQLEEESGLKIFYDGDYVAARDSTANAHTRNERLYGLLLLFYPFLGLAWSRTKQRLSEIGFEPQAITAASTLIEFAVAFVELIFFGAFHSGFLELIKGTPMSLDLAIAGSLFTDCIVRYSQTLSGAQCPSGFLEWLLPWRLAPRDD